MLEGPSTDLEAGPVFGLDDGVATRVDTGFDLAPRLLPTPGAALPALPLVNRVMHCGTARRA
jgi:hypothetical protein